MFRRTHKKQTVETARDRMALAHEAGMRRISAVSVLAGTLVAYGALVVVLAIAGSIAAAVGVDTDLGSYNFHSLGISGGIALAAGVLISYLFGGYVAGRMARRAGAVNGLIVFILGLVIAAVVGGAVTGLAGTHGVVQALRDLGLPPTWARGGGIAGFSGLAVWGAMIIGSIAGGTLGERWHTKLLVRAMDPAIGPETRTRTRATATDTNDVDTDSPADVDDVDVRDRDRDRGA